MSPEVRAATNVGACRIKIISAGTPYLAKNPCSLATQSGSTLAFTAACAMTYFVGADPAWRFLAGAHNPTITKSAATVRLMVNPFRWRRVGIASAAVSLPRSRFLPVSLVDETALVQ